MVFWAIEFKVHLRNEGTANIFTKFVFQNVWGRVVLILKFSTSQLYFD